MAAQISSAWIEVVLKNKVLRLIELVQEGAGSEIVSAFKAENAPSLSQRIALVGEARDFHQLRAQQLWLESGKIITVAQRRATARAELASFVFAYLTGDAGEHKESAVEALTVLGRQAEVVTVNALSKT